MSKTDIVAFDDVDGNALGSTVNSDRGSFILNDQAGK